MKNFIGFAIVALMLTPATGEAQDYTPDPSVIRKLAEQGNAVAQFTLGVMYDNGDRLMEDHTEAVRWYRLAAEKGLAEAQFNLGNMYHDGEGVLQNSAETVRWYRMAAQQEYARAQLNLGVMYGHGHGVPQDHVTAHMWFNIAAANGSDIAAENRNVAEKRMNAFDISTAQRRARVCMESGYQDCD